MTADSGKMGLRARTWVGMWLGVKRVQSRECGEHSGGGDKARAE